MGYSKITITICILLLLTAGGSASTHEKMVDALNGFGIRLYRDLINDKENVFCSPLSVTALLNALLIATSDDAAAAAEIRNTLGYTTLGLSTLEARSALHEFLSILGRNRAGLVSGNSIWMQGGINLRPDVQSEMVSKLRIDGHKVDFANPNSTTGQMNSWIRKLANNSTLKISNREVDPATKLLFAGVVDFSGGTWHYQFVTSKTKREPFYTDQGQNVVYVPMMLMSGYFNYAENIDLNSELVEIPYAGKEVTMVILLPKEINGIENQKSLLSLDAVVRAIQEMEETQVHLRIPRFNVLSSLNLKNTLNNFGMVKSFTPGQAELSGVDGPKDLSVSQVFQKTVINVSEKGSLPDPLVPISSGMASHDYDVPRMTYFTASHPFTFLIRHKPTGGILFIGQVVKP